MATLNCRGIFTAISYIYELIEATEIWMRCMGSLQDQCAVQPSLYWVSGIHLFCISYLQLKNLVRTLKTALEYCCKCFPVLFMMKVWHFLSDSHCHIIFRVLWKFLLSNRYGNCFSWVFCSIYSSRWFNIWLLDLQAYKLVVYLPAFKGRPTYYGLDQQNWNEF
jgi:hypothetical protein